MREKGVTNFNLLFKKTILLFLVFFISCSESSSDKKSSAKSTATSTSDNTTQDDNSSTTEETTHENVAEEKKSEAVEVSNKELGINVSAPEGLVNQEIAPSIKIEALRKTFDEGLPGDAILVGKGATIQVEDPEKETAVDGKYFADNYDVRMQIDSSVLTENVAFAVRTISESGEEITQIVTQGRLQIHENSETGTSELTFKAGGSTVDIQPVDLKSLKLTSEEIYVPLPKNPQQVSCEADSPFTGKISWGLPGGAIAGYKIMQSTSEQDALNNVGCENGTQLSDLTGSAHEYALTNLSADTNYYFRICAYNARFPVDNSPGVVCSIKTQEPEFPTLQIAYTTLNNTIRYGTKSDGDWSLETVSNTANSKPVFETDHNNNPYLVFIQNLSDGSPLVVANKTGEEFVLTDINNTVAPDLTIYDQHWESLAPYKLILDTNLNLELFFEKNTTSVTSLAAVDSYVATFSNSTWSAGSFFKQQVMAWGGGFDYSALGNLTEFTIDKNNDLYLYNYGQAKLYLKNATGWQEPTTFSANNVCQEPFGNFIINSDYDGNLHGAFTCTSLNGNCGLYTFTGSDPSANPILIDTLYTSTSCPSFFGYASSWGQMNDKNTKLKINFDKENHVYILYDVYKLMETVEGNSAYYPVELKMADNTSGQFMSKQIISKPSTVEMTTFAQWPESETATWTTINNFDFALDKNGKYHILYNEHECVYDCGNSSNGYAAEHNCQLNYLTNLTSEIETIDAVNGQDLYGSGSSGCTPYGIKVNDMKFNSVRYPQ